jgi:hypothetical protein
MLVLLYWNKGGKLQLEAVLLFAVEKLRWCRAIYMAEKTTVQPFLA